MRKCHRIRYKNDPGSKKLVFGAITAHNTSNACLSLQILIFSMHAHTGSCRFIKEITVLSKTGIKWKSADA
jgi:hypothetical protein